MRTIELLAPAKNLECGIEAIRHGADAVYIGAGRFGARAAAGNPVDDIRKLAEYAHFFRAKVYVALNTILKDSELNDAEKLAWELYEAGADALIVQDMGLLKLHLPPIPLHDVLIGHMNKNAGGKVFGSRRQSPQAGRFRGSQDRYSRCRSRAFW